MHIQFISDEIFVKIFSYLGPRAVCQCTKVCKRWNRLTQDPTLWRSLFLKQFKKYIVDEESHRQANQPSWKDLFILKANWSSGHCKVQNLIFSQESATSTLTKTSIDPFPKAVKHLKISNCGIEYLSSVNNNANTVHIWSLRNKSYDHRVYCDDVIVSLAFGSKQTSKVLAIGLKSGKFQLWDFEKKTFVAVQDNRLTNPRTGTGNEQNNFGNSISLINLSDDKLVTVSNNSVVRLWQINVKRTGNWMCSCLCSLTTLDRRCKVLEVQLKSQEKGFPRTSKMGCSTEGSEDLGQKEAKVFSWKSGKCDSIRTFNGDAWWLTISYVVEASEEWNLIGFQKFSFEGSRLRGDNFECPVETSYGQEHEKRNGNPHGFLEENSRSRQLMGTRHDISCLSISPCSHIITSGQSDNTIHLWDTRTRSKTHTLFGHTGAVTCVQVDFHKVVSGSRDRKVKVWSLETGNCQLTLPENHSSGVTCVTFNDQWVVSGDNQGEIKVWDFAARSQDTLYWQDAAM